MKFQPRDFRAAIVEGRAFAINGPIEWQAQRGVIESLTQHLEGDPQKAIFIQMHSLGGSAETTKAIIEMIKMVMDYRPVVICAHAISSMAVPMFLVPPPDHRVLYRSSSVYCHWTNFVHEIRVEGAPPAHRYAMAEYAAKIAHHEQVNDWLQKALADGTGMSLQEAKELLDNPRVLEGPEACERGFAGNLW